MQNCEPVLTLQDSFEILMFITGFKIRWAFGDHIIPLCGFIWWYCGECGVVYFRGMMVMVVN